MKTRSIFISLMAVSMFAIVFSGPAFAALYLPSNATATPSGVQNKDVFTSTLSQQNETVNVTIVNFAFNPSNITVANGTTVVWTNKESFISHDVTSDAKVIDINSGLKVPVFKSPNLGPGASFAFQFNKTGTFGYYCAEHPFMRGTVVVT